MPNTEVDVLVVGAGLTGLTAANELQKHLLRVIVVDKGRKPGGRLATKQLGPGVADVGAQYFTTRTPEFQTQVEQWLTQGLVYRWSTGWSDGSLTEIKPYGHFRYAVTGGMEELAKHLAEGVDVRLQKQIVALTPLARGWQAQDEAGEIYTSRAVLFTAPAPQSLAILNQSEVLLAHQNQIALERIEYAPSLTALFLIDGAANLPEPGAIRRPNMPISWIADNHRKGISPEATVITLQTTPAYGRQLWEATDTEILTILYEGLQPFLTPTSKLVESSLKRWRYALPTTLHTDRYLLAKNRPILVFAGDAFGSPLIEGAVLSGTSASIAIGSQFSITMRPDSR